MPSSTPLDEQKPVPRAGFTLPLDIVIAPGRAFLKIAQTSEWFPGLIVIALAGAATTALDTSPILHIARLAKSGGVAPTQTDIAELVGFQAIVIPLLVVMLAATFVTALARWKDPTAPYRRSLSVAVNCMVPSALGGLLHAIVAVAREPYSTMSFRAFDSALPDSLGAFAAPGSEREFEFLARFGLWDAWSFVLLGFGISLFVGMRFSTALLISAGLYFLYVTVYN